MQLNSFDTSGNSPTQYYTYLYLRVWDGEFPAGTPYYVGKGCNKRAFKWSDHRLAIPEDPTYIIIQHFDTEADAFEAEKFLITYYGRIDLGTGCLRNLTEGGEGCSGRTLSSEVRRKISDAHAGKTLSAQTRAKISTAHKGKTLPEEQRKKMSESRMGRQFSVATREKISIANTGKHHSEETCRKISQLKTGVKQSAETIRKRVESNRGYRHSLDTINKIKESNKRTWREKHRTCLTQ